LGEIRRSRRSWLVALLLFVVLAAVAHPYWLAALGHVLVNAEPPRKADVIVVLAGDWMGHRIVRGAELVRQGYATKALVSSPVHHYGVPEGDLAVQFAERKGFDRAGLEPILIKGNSTQEEAIELLREVRRRGARRVLIVTSDFHTRRTRRIYESLRGDLEVFVTAAPYPAFHPDTWWKAREGRKVWLLEFTKLVTGAFGI
jgi:uncharacterized SAM-binding protein YcdF (DUF218 family)